VVNRFSIAITQWAEMGLVDIVRLAEDRERESYRRFV